MCIRFAEKLKASAQILQLCSVLLTSLKAIRTHGQELRTPFRLQGVKIAAVLCFTTQPHNHKDACVHSMFAHGQ